MTPAGYQGIEDKDIPAVPLEGDAGVVRVIAGEFAGVKGPARTFTPINLLDVRLRAGKPPLRLSLKDGYTASFYVLSGEVLLNGSEKASGTELVVLDREGDEVTLEAVSDTVLFVMNGAPIEEPVAGYGPFVMNTHQQIQEAFKDFHAGRMGTIPAEAVDG
jgi:redox-sensitive bicupin YhaK (pirin superfamily)